MSSPPAGIPEADWLATPASVRTLILAQQQEIQALRKENDELRGQPAGADRPQLLPIERVDEVVEHHPDACRRCGTRSSRSRRSRRW
jgi:hypothetical protein